MLRLSPSVASVLAVLLIASVATVHAGSVDDRSSSDNRSSSDERSSDVSVLRQYPIADAFEVPPVTSIGLTAPSEYSPARIRESSSITVVGSQSGSHAVTLRLSDDAQTLILDPVTPFTYNEMVEVRARVPLASGVWLVDRFRFRTMVRAVAPGPMLQKMSDAALVEYAADTSEVVPDTLPPINVTVDNGGTIGTYYLANFGLNKAPNHNFLFALDEHGQVVKSQNRYHSNPLDFKVQPDGHPWANGTRTFFDAGAWGFISVDTNWNPVDTFMSANGYLLDEHELRLLPQQDWLPSGGYAVLAVSVTTLDSTQYVDGMVPNATIGGNVIQLFDAHRNLVFEWRGIDHYRVADAVHEKLGDSAIDFEHANSLEFDADGNIIISNRHLSEISKIALQTGDFQWRMGGAHNEFAMLGDSIWYSYQHCARLLPNGHMTLFDNADFDSVTGRPLDSAGAYLRHSRALELEIDAAARTARVVWQYHHSPETFSVAMGSVQRLRNGHTVIGWGLNFSNAITEVNRNGDVLFEMNMGPKNVSYRAFLDPVDSLMSVTSTEHRAPSTAALSLQLSATDRGTAASFTLDKSEAIAMSVLDALGRDVVPAVTSFEPEGEHRLELDSQRLPSGAYFCTIRTASGASAMAGFVK